MTHVITQNCCNDTACVFSCPVNCIHPGPDEPGYQDAEMLYIDPQACIDCGACVDVCPVNAIYPDFDLPDNLLRYAELNAHYYTNPAVASYNPNQQSSSMTEWQPPSDEPLRVAIIGSGPSGCYVAQELFSQRGLDVRVDMFERLATPGGLVRFGVAPDHQSTKGVSASFARTMRHENFRLFLNVDVGTDLGLDELRKHYHATVYATGATGDTALGIAGEDLPGSHSANEFVAWYNGHPDYADRRFDLSGERAVILGNGNVALDVARVLVAGPEHLGRTDIADHALAQLATSNIREVIVVGRRGPAQAAFTTPELLGLSELKGVDVVVRADEAATPVEMMPLAQSTAAYKAALLEELAHRPASRDKRIELRFCTSATRMLGEDHVEAVELCRNQLINDDGAIVAKTTLELEHIETGLVLRSVGYRGQRMDGLPFDENHGVLPNDGGRIVEAASGSTLHGLYTTGWIKRGPSGVIGTNKSCARETVTAMLEDWAEGRLPTPVSSAHDDVAALVPEHLDLVAWTLIDAHERAAGEKASRPRIKVVDRAELLRIGRTPKQ